MRYVGALLVVFGVDSRNVLEHLLSNQACGVAMQNATQLAKSLDFNPRDVSKA